MAHNHRTAQYRHWYAKLLRFYPKSYRERFGEGMEQTFSDLCRERREAGEGLFGFVMWTFADTIAGIMREEIKLTQLLITHVHTMAKIIYASFILAGVAILGYAAFGRSSNQSFVYFFGSLWLACSIVGSFLDARFGHGKSKV